MIYLWRFFIGGLTAFFFGLAALFFIAPLLPGDAPVTGSAAIRSEPEGPDARRHYLPNGVSIATRSDWPLIAGENLHQFDRFGLSARAGDDTRILLAVADAGTPELMSGVLILIDAGDTRTTAQKKLQAFMDRIRPKLTEATVIHEAQPTEIAGFGAAWGGFRAVQEGRIGRRTVQARAHIVHVDRRAVLAIGVSMIGSAAGNQLNAMLETLRAERS
ncbi:MAG: hypothetical protein AAGD13_16910 [Pseudomonadota bacterium]